MSLSPWIEQLKRTRAEHRLSSNKQTDIAIIGGGIAGISSAYYTLKNTEHHVVLIEAGLIAHGATGHNAGQAVSYFERPFASIVAEFGLEMAAQAQDHLNNAWIDLEEIIRDANIQTPLSRCTGYVGFSTKEQALNYLEDAYWRKKAGITIEHSLYLAKAHADWLEEMPADHAELVSLITHHEIQAMLETDDAQFVAAGFSPKGCLNSALFTEELAGYLLATYPHRFMIYERSPVSTLELTRTDTVLHITGHTIRAKKTVLCTNGFEHITILNRDGEDVNTRFHQQVSGTIGYMTAYLDPIDQPPTAISYFPKDTEVSKTGEVYYYLTRRPFEKEKHIRHNLVCVGGPEEALPEGKNYQRSSAFPKEHEKEINAFIDKTYEQSPNDGMKADYRWHGLMGYTSNGIRMVGPEPCNPNLLYNLGCNGIGILPSIYGGKRIAKWLSGKKPAPSIFDPRDYRCELPTNDKNT